MAGKKAKGMEKPKKPKEAKKGKLGEAGRPAKREKSAVEEKGKTAEKEKKEAKKVGGAVEKGEKKQVGKKAGEKEERKRVSKSKEAKRLAMLVKKKKRYLFRGRFGKRSVRNVSKRKWQRWRMPRGIDIYFKREDGRIPGTGYRTPKSIRFVHPSGFGEALVRNAAEVEALAAKKETVAARISAAVGRKKRQEILKKAEELGVFVLNR